MHLSIESELILLKILSTLLRHIKQNCRIQYEEEPKIISSVIDRFFFENCVGKGFTENNILSREMIA